MSIIFSPGSNDEARKKRMEQFFEIIKTGGWDKEPQLLKLMEKGIYVDAESDGKMPLHHAALKGYATLTETLINEGAEIDAQTPEGNTSLHEAMEYGEQDSAEILVNHHADIEAQNDNHTAPMRLAATEGHLGCAFYLLKKGANSNVDPNYNRGVNYVEVWDSVIKFAKDHKWAEAYKDFSDNGTAPQSAEDVYHLLAVYPLKDPTAPVDRKTHLRQIFSHAKWKSQEQASGIIQQLHEDGTINAVFAEELQNVAEEKLQTMQGRARC